MSENYLSRFLAELSLDRMLSAGAAPEAPAPAAPCAVAPAQPRPFSPDVAPGDLRLLPQAGRLTYMAVVSDLGDHAFLAVPLSLHSVPADDREMLAEGVSGIGFQVYQVWNRVAADADVLAQTWKVGTLEARELRRLREFVAARASGRPLPAELRALTSVPVTADDDPRWEYFAAEKAFFAPFARANRLARRNRDAVADFALVAKVIPFPVAADAPALAAAPAQPDRVVDCAVDGCEATVQLECSPQKRVLRAAFYDRDDNPSAACDGWLLVDGAGAALGVVAGGKCRVDCPEGFDGRCGLKDKGGAMHPFLPAAPAGE